MAASDITISRCYPIINGFVQVPPMAQTDMTRVSEDDALIAIPGSEVVSLSGGSGRPTGRNCGAQAFLRLPALAPGASYATNPVDDLA